MKSESIIIVLLILLGGCSPVMDSHPQNGPAKIFNDKSKVNSKTSVVFPSPVPGRKIDKFYDGEGNLFSETDLFSDPSNGFYRSYHRNGRVALEVRYRNGLVTHDKAFDEKGRPIFRQGKVKTYYANCHLASVEHYRNDAKNGKAVYYNTDGVTVVDIWNYMDGRKVGEHIRNDRYGHFSYSEDWGYPATYVQKFQNIIKILGGFLVLGLSGLIFYMIKSRRARS